MKKKSLLALTTLALLTAATSIAQPYNVITPASTQNYILKFTSANGSTTPTADKSQIFDNGTNFVGIGATSSINGEYVLMQMDQAAVTSGRVANNSTSTSACANF